LTDTEFLHNITIGQYLPADSPIHRLHPTTKMLMAGLCVTAAILSGSLGGFLIMLLAVTAGLKIARIPLGYAYRGLRPAVPIIALVALIQILFSSQSDRGAVLWSGWIITITAGDFLAAGTMAVRLAVLILIISLFTLCTSSKELTHGTEQMLRPLGRIGFPAHELALVLTIALRFLPLLAMEAERLIKAQVSRGADFGRRRVGLFKRIYRMFPLFVPLFLASLRRGEHLALAMEARCYTGGKGRTRLIRFRFGPADGAAIAAAALLTAVVLAAHFLRVDRVVLPGLAGG
jgi:energy-coupling factor transport system permease protein